MVNHLPETPLFFEHDGARLFGVLYEPVVDAERPKGRGIVFCAPFAEEAGISQKVCVEFARVLARRGYHVLRFDYRGCGESEGDSDSVTLGTQSADVQAATGWFRRNVGPRVGLGGLRLGASLAAMVAAKDPSIESLALWEPVAWPADHIKNFLRMQVVADNVLAGRVVATREELLGRLKSGHTVDVLGYPFTSECVRDFLEADLLGQIGGTHGPTLVMAIGRQTRSRKDLQAIVDAYVERGRPVDFDRAAEQPFWIDPGDPWRELASWQGHEGLFRQTADWLDRIGNS